MAYPISRTSKKHSFSMNDISVGHKQISKYCGNFLISLFENGLKHLAMNIFSNDFTLLIYKNSYWNVHNIV